MGIRFLNTFSCDARFPRGWRTGTLCLLVETGDGLVLVDTGPGLDDYARRPGIIRTFQVVTRVPLDPEETAVRQVARLGHRPEDVRAVVLTHMHFDHCGGLPDFPAARVHVHAREWAAFHGRPGRWTDLAYVRRHVAHGPAVELHESASERWFGLPAIRLPFDPPILLVPLFGHTRGHCGVAVHTDDGWLFHVGDAAPVDLGDYAPGWLVRLVLGPHAPRLRRFRAANPRLRVTTGHMWRDFFTSPLSAPDDE